MRSVLREVSVDIPTDVAWIYRRRYVGNIRYQNLEIRSVRRVFASSALVAIFRVSVTHKAHRTKR